MPAQAPGIRADVRTSTLFIHDNLAVLRGLDSESVDLIATDPPFNTKRVFKAPAESRATGQRFDDRWRWNDVTAEWSDVLASDRPGVRKVIEAAAAIEGGSVEPRTGAIMTGRTTNSMAAYLCWMAPRLAECRRILKPTGSIYLHCDDSADSYLRLLMDAVFGRAAYRNTIIWKRQSGNNSATHRCGRITDTLLFYAPGRNTWNGGRHNTLSPGELREYKLAPDGRRYKCDDLTAARPDSDSGNFEWRGCLPPPSRGWAYRLEIAEAFDVQTTPPTRTRTVPSCRVGSTGLHGLPARC